MAGKGSTGNVIAALSSFILPGLGQLIQGRPIMALVMFIMTAGVWVITFGILGGIMHIVAALEAAIYKPRNP